jgi:hypothetical protein
MNKGIELEKLTRLYQLAQKANAALVREIEELRERNVSQKQIIEELGEMISEMKGTDR